MKRLVVCLIVSVLLVASVRAEGYRTSIGEGDAQIAVVVVKGTPFEMGKRLGELTKDETRELISRFLAAYTKGDAVALGQLDAAWAAMEPHVAETFLEELRGLAEGTEIPLVDLKRAYMMPVLAPYSCSSIAAWGKATADGKLYMTRNLDWNLAICAHDFPCIQVFIPDEGIPSVNVSFAGYTGTNTGMNAKGFVHAEMGDSPGRDAPYDCDGIHFTILLRDIMTRAGSLEEALALFKEAKHIKKYHYVFGDGAAKAGIKIRAHTPKPFQYWSDNDPADELAPNVLEAVVYQDEGRGAYRPLKEAWGKIDAATLQDIAKAIPIKGSNVLDVVYNGTDLELWASYAKGKTEAYQRPFVHFRLKDYLD